MRVHIFGFLLLSVFMQVNAEVLAQTISIDRKNTTIQEVLNILKKQTNYVFIHNSKVLDQNKINIKLRDASINEVLDECFKGMPFEYSFLDKNVLIKYKEPPPFLKHEISKGEIVKNLQEIQVSGQVKDEQDNVLSGVSVKVKGSTQGTITDQDGKYVLVTEESNITLVFSFIGFVSQEVAVAGQRVINIEMKEYVGDLDEVVVVGYGTQKKITLTGSVDAISGEALENRSATLVSDLIKGASPNLNITMGMRGGEPGATSSWNIRGLGSINANAAPLILVDGVEVNVNNIDPESIESISVLKDASASAIYGSRAPFGVILITTKKGKAGRTSVEYNNNVGLNKPIGMPSFVDALTWATAYNQANANANLAAVYSDEQMKRIIGYMNGTFPHEYDPERPIDNIFAGRRNGNANYDWPSILIADNSLSQKHHINLSGGTNNTNYYLSGGFVNQDGMYRYGNDNYKRYNFLTNLNSQVTDWLNLRSSVKYAKGMSDYPIGQTTVGREHMIGEMLTFGPMMPMYNINGTIQSPLIRWQQDSGRDTWESNDSFFNLGTDIEPVKGWVTSISYNHNIINSRSFSHPKPVMVELGTGQFGNIGKPSSGFGASYGQTNYSLLNAITSYQKIINDHYFNGLLGYEQEERKFSSLAGQGTGLITDRVPSLTTSLGEKSVTDGMNHWATQGVFGRINYNYQEKYLFEASARYNGSSRFSPDTRWGFFPSASIGYVLSQEEFWKPIETAINNFKLRASYGSLGNQNVGLYSYLSTIGVGSELDWIVDGERPQYANPPGLISRDLTWETITTTNLGIDAGFMHNKLQLTFDWYNRVTTNMLGPTEQLPYQLGVATPNRNNAELSTKGFELILSWADRVSSDFSYNLKVGLGDNRATILKYFNEKELIDTWYPGKAVGEIWGYTTDGIIQEVGETIPDQSKFHARWQPGDIKYMDLNGDGAVNDGTRTLNDYGDVSVIGNTTPRYNYSISGGIDWKGLDFSMFWQGIGKRDYFPPNSMQVFWGMLNGTGNSGVYRNSEILNYWRPANETNLLGPNTNAYFAQPYFSTETNKNKQVQTRYLLNASYLRLKNLQVGYTLPTSLTNKLHLQRTRIYLSGENLLTITKLPGTFDPETTIASDPANGGYQAGRVYPMSRAISLGINLTF